MYNIGNQGKIMRKLLGKASVDSSHDNGLGVTSSPHQNYRASASQNAVYTVGAPIASIDQSPDGRSVILASRRVLRTVSLDGLSIREGVDIRGMITAQHANKSGGSGNGGSGSSSISDQLSIKDVKWGTVQGNGSIFTGCLSGKIFHYDLTTLSANVAGGSNLDVIQMREDSRQINTLDINPHRGTLLLSGSQDGLVRCFDIRVPVHTRTGYSFRSAQAFKCNADGVRQVKWSPKDGFLFACGTEQGVVLKWDIRKPNAPMLRINAHEKVCTSISWHPDGDHLISGGLDSKCLVWDLSKTADKRQKPKWVISTPAPVAVVAWRPGQWSATAHARRAAQVAISYDESNQNRSGINAVHIWDLGRPTMPYKEVQRFESSPNAMLWHDRDLLWTAGQDGLFNQCDVAFAPKVLDRQPVSTLAFSSQGDAVILLDERPISNRPRPHSLHGERLPLHAYTAGSGSGGPLLSVSRSDSEDDVSSSFLSNRRTGRKRRPSMRSVVPLSTTPPNASSADDKVLSLEQAIKMTNFKTQQAMAIGPVPAAVNVAKYGYLSTSYLDALAQHLPAPPNESTLLERITTILEHFARTAEIASLFRLAQTWRIILHATTILLRRRAQFHFELRMENLKLGIKRNSEARTEAPGFQLGFADNSATEVTPRRASHKVQIDERTYSQSLQVSDLEESTSNVPTPLARPVRVESDVPDFQDVMRESYVAPKKLTPIIEPESYTHGAGARFLSPQKRNRLGSEPLSVTSQETAETEASTEGYDFYDTEALSHAIYVPQPRKRTPLSSGLQDTASSVLHRTQVGRQDSDDSMTQMFSISNGSRQITGPDSSLGSSTTTQSRFSLLGAGDAHDASETWDGDFASRIQGRRTGEQTENGPLVPRHQGLVRTDTSFTAYTDEHQIITQTTDSFDSPTEFAPSLPDTRASIDQSASRLARRRNHSQNSHVTDEAAPHITENDYLHWHGDPPFPFPIRSREFSSSRTTPFQPYTIISRALAFEVKSSALHASAMILLLKPLLPDEVIDQYQAAAILRQHHARLMNMKLFVEAALLRKLCLKGWPEGALADWGEDYPTLFEQAQHNVEAHFLCSNCHKPREIDRRADSKDSIWRCESCKSAMAPCSICGHRDDAPTLALSAWPAITSKTSETTEDIAMSTWWYCPGCGHGGHSGCMQEWHAIDPTESSQGYAPKELSGGFCPLDGCGHACIPGRGRDEISTSRAEEVIRAVREAARAEPDHFATSRRASRDGSHGMAGVSSDRNDIPQSRAVASVRETLNAGVGSQGSSPGRATSLASFGKVGEGKEGERERRKSVKFVANEERK